MPPNVPVLRYLRRDDSWRSKKYYSVIIVLEGSSTMQNFTGPFMNPRMIEKDTRDENGLQSLAMYYQSLFDIEENLNHYSWNDYQSAKRKFVKYLMKSRSV
jgi:hypothetical protein